MTAQRHISLREARRWGLIMTALLLIICAINLRMGNVRVFYWLFGAAVVFFTFSTFLTGPLVPLYAIFTKAMRLFGRFNTRLILCCVFYLIITPYGFAMKLLKRDMLEKKIDKKRSSYWIKVRRAGKEISHYESGF